MTTTDYALEMSNTPSDPNDINPKALEGFMRAFDKALFGWARTNLDRAQLATEAKRQMEDLEVMKQQSLHEEPTITYVPRRKEPRRTLGWFSMIRYNRDTIRLRKY